MALENGDFVFAVVTAPAIGYCEAHDRMQSPPIVSIGNATCCAVAQSGALAAFGASTTPYLAVYNTSGWGVLGVPYSGGEIRALAFSPDGSRLAVAHVSAPFVTLYDTATWTKLPDPVALPAGAANAVAWAPDGSRLAVGHANSPFITIYDTSTWAKLANPSTLPSSESTAVSYAPNGQRLAVGCNGGPFVTIYDTTSYATVPAPTLGAPVKCLAYSPSGGQLAVSQASSEYLKLLDTTTWSGMARPEVASLVHGFSWVHDGEIMVACEAWPRLLRLDLTTGAMTNYSASGYIGRGVAAVPYTPKHISGAIRDINLNGVTRTVRAYRRDTGVLIGSATSHILTGAYSIPCSYEGEHTVVMVDDLVGTIENDQVLRTTPV